MSDSSDAPTAREVADRLDLVALATELLGQPKGASSSAKWPSPVPDHTQTGATPPMGIYIGRDNRMRWKCFATGEGGDALDLIATARGVSLKEAYIEGLDRLGGVPPGLKETVVRPTPPPPRELPSSDDLRMALSRLSPVEGEHQWLRDHGLSASAANTYEIGRVQRHRFPGLEHPVRNGFAMPVSDRLGDLVGVDIRVIGSDTKYLSLRTAEYQGLNFVRAQRRMRPDLVAVTEGSIDAIAMAAHGGCSTVGITSASADPAAVAEQLDFIDRKVVLAIDNDSAGRSMRDGLRSELLGRGHEVIDLDLGQGDVGDFLKRGGLMSRKLMVSAPHADMAKGWGFSL